MSIRRQITEIICDQCDDELPVMSATRFACTPDMDRAGWRRVPAVAAWTATGWESGRLRDLCASCVNDWNRERRRVQAETRTA